MAGKRKSAPKRKNIHNKEVARIIVDNLHNKVVDKYYKPLKRLLWR